MHTVMCCRSGPWTFVVIARNSTLKCETTVNSCPDVYSMEWSLSSVGLTVGGVRPNSRAGEINGERSLRSCSTSSVSTCAQQARGA